MCLKSVTASVTVKLITIIMAIISIPLITTLIILKQARSPRGRGRPPPPPWRPGGPFSARAARRKGPTRPREAQFLESLEVLRATRALSERPEGPMDVQRAPVQGMGPFQRSRRGPLSAREGALWTLREGALSRRPPPPGRHPGYVPVLKTLV